MTVTPIRPPTPPPPSGPQGWPETIRNAVLLMAERPDIFFVVLCDDEGRFKS